MHARLTFKARIRLAAIAAILIPAATAASPALAHDSLSSTSPARDAVITHAPETVSLTLSEPPADSKNLNLSTIIVTDGAGKTVSDGKVTVYGPTLSTNLTEGSPGTYKVLWRAVSSDGHPIEGNYTLTIQAPAGQSATPSIPASPAAAPSASPAASTTAERPNNDGAPLALGIAAMILAAAVGAVLVLRNRRKNTGA
ncbi:copper resistance protein CopC [Arthrobacter sp. H-02-3]|nr:copper resistance protein CopC [Arthrobacter sp. H-02-3]